MDIVLPNIIHEQPTKAWILSLFPEGGYKVKLAYDIAVKIWIRTRLSERQNHRCCWCGIRTIMAPNKSTSATIEHIIPKAHGGTNDEDNLAMSCSRCNHRRGTRSVDDFFNSGDWKRNVEHLPRLAHKPGRDRRRKEQLAVMLSLTAGSSNPYQPGTRAHRTFERYKDAPSLRLKANEAKVLATMAG